MGETLGAADESEVSRFLTAWLAVRQIVQAANFNHFSKAGLSATQFMTLNLLPAAGEGLTMGELARRLNLKPATVAKTVDSLEERKLLRRLRNVEDRRQVIVEITKQGRNLQNAAAGQFRLHIEEIFAKISPADRKALIQGLESFVSASQVQPQERSGSTQDANGGPRVERSSRRSRPQ